MGCVPSKINLRENTNIYNPVYWHSQDECCICLDRKSNILLLPCNHITLCDVCCRDSIYANFNKCPICQHDVYSYNFLQIVPVIPT